MACAWRTKDHNIPIEERSNYQKSFLQCMNLWEDRPDVAPLTFHPKVCQAAAELMEVDACRVWHDQALYKEAHGRETDAHQDHPYWPIKETNSITAWIPFVQSTLENGAVGYLPGSARDRHAQVREHLLRRAREDPRRARVHSEIEPVFVEVPPGSVAFHHGLTVHLAGANNTDVDRAVHTIIFFPDGSTRGYPFPHFSVDRGGIEVGQQINSDATPLACPRPADEPIPPLPAVGFQVDSSRHQLRISSRTRVVAGCSSISTTTCEPRRASFSPTPKPCWQPRRRRSTSAWKPRVLRRLPEPNRGWTPRSTASCRFSAVRSPCASSTSTHPTACTSTSTAADGTPAPSTCKTCGSPPSRDACNVAVVSVEYGLAPETPFPGMADDCETAAMWLVDNALDEFGTDRLTIGGESAGAHLSSVILLRLRERGAIDKFVAANLVYGMYDLALTDFVRSWGTRNLILNTPIIEWCVESLTPGLSEAQRRDPGLSAMYADLTGLPPVLFTCGTDDPTLHDSKGLYERWQAANGNATLEIYEAGFHAFNLFPSKMADVSNRSQERFISAAVKGLINAPH